jgi:hypothetical protein
MMPDVRAFSTGQFYQGALEGTLNFVTSMMSRFITMGQSGETPIPLIQPSSETEAVGMVVATMAMGALSLRQILRRKQTLLKEASSSKTEPQGTPSGMSWRTR